MAAPISQPAREALPVGGERDFLERALRWKHNKVSGYTAQVIFHRNKSVNSQWSFMNHSSISKPPQNVKSRGTIDIAEYAISFTQIDRTLYVREQYRVLHCECCLRDPAPGQRLGMYVNPLYHGSRQISIISH